jgi:hypothetical protein
MAGRAYLQTWTGGVEAARQRAGYPIGFAASNQYPRLGVEPGDTLYIAYLDGASRLTLIGRLFVGELIDRKEMVQRIGPEPWEATWYALASQSRAPDRYRFDLTVPAAIVAALRFMRATGEITVLETDSSGAVDGRALQSIRRLAGDSAQLLDAVIELEDESEVGAQARGRRSSAEERSAIELHAMEVATGHFSSERWTVTDVGATRPYDLLCEQPRRELHVEVKGTTGDGSRVELTRNEVEHALVTQSELALAVVSHVELNRESPPRASGGMLSVIQPWQIDSADLIPLRFSYLVPG